MTDDELPIERGFPIERVNEIAEKEGRAKMHYRPIYTMHKWWARRLGCVFRAICLYTLLDDPEKVEVFEPGDHQNESINDLPALLDVEELIDNVSIDDPESLWELYRKDVQIHDKKILDPFMGGGTSLVESSRFNAEVHGRDLNPVAWFITKKELEAGQTEPNDLDAAFEEVKNAVKDQITRYYETSCPNTDGEHKADVMYYFWTKELDCPSCGDTVSLFRDYRVGKGRYGEEGYHIHCPECHEIQLVDDWQSETSCGNCDEEFDPSAGTASRGDYVCRQCGMKYPIIDAIDEQDGFDLRMYAVEYYCRECEEHGAEKSEYKGYKKTNPSDRELYEEAADEWDKSEELREYVPDHKIPLGIKTDSSQFEGNISGGHSLLRQGYSEWTDMYNDRQLLCLGKLLQAIDSLDDQNAKEFLMLAFSDGLRTNSMMAAYETPTNKIDHIFRDNNFNPPLYPAENNVWGTVDGRGTFTAMWDMVRSGVEYANAPTERYMEQGETIETGPFEQPIGKNASVELGDARKITAENEYDAVITDPPYYDNVIYSELSDFFYVWLRLVLNSDYEGFEEKKTPRAESIVANPAVQKGAEEFETEIGQSFEIIHNTLRDDGVLTFTYHHAGVESWGELLASLCDAGFEVTATYPISAETNKFFKGESVEFDIIIVARPAQGRREIAWPDLRQRIYQTARDTRRRLEANRELSRGDIGVVEMGECFHEYSKHHGNVHRQGEVMTAKEVVEEIYGIIQEASEIGATEVFIDLLQESDPDYDMVNKLTRGANTRPDELKERALFNTDDGFTLGTWDDEQRIAYLEDALREGDLTDLGRLQYLRYRYDREMSIGHYVDRWLDADLRKLANKLAAATNDDVYTEMLEITGEGVSKGSNDGSGNGQTGLDDYT